MKLKTYLTAGLLTLGAPLTAQANLQFDTQGLGNFLTSDGPDVITIDSFDWTPHSFLAKGGTSAITNALLQGGDCGAACEFDVYVHGVLGVATLNNVGVWTGSNTGDAQVEITYILKFTETVTFADDVTGISQFSVKEEDGVQFEMYWDETPDADALTGSGYNDGTVILFGDEIADATGLFLTTDLEPQQLDQHPTPGDNDYDGQDTIMGTGSNSIIEIGGLTQDSNFFLGTLTEFGFDFTNVSLSLPYNNVNPSDCFNGNFNGALGASAAAGCNDSHIDGTFEQNEGDGNPAGTFVPRTGSINGGPQLPDSLYNGTACITAQDPFACPDFVAQSDNNSGFEVEEVPEPGTLAITGLGLLLLGARRRRNRV